MATKLEELNVTSEELERFKAAFQDARFRELFAQYAEEISNPENRRRYEQEIRELERERGVDVQFIHPEPGHVLQTSVNGQQTCYLNVCSNPRVCKPHCVPGTDKEGRSGKHWSLPCTLTPAREELGPGGMKEVVYDVCFHPDTLHLASRNDKFRSMVDLTALDSVSQNFSVVLDPRNVRTLSEKYKGVPQAAVLRKTRPGAAPKPQDPHDPLHFPYPYDLPSEQKRRTVRHHGGVKPLRQEPTVPNYTIRHRSYVDLQDYRDSRDSAPSPVPKELVITVDLPLLSSANDVNLHIKGKDLRLESQRPAYKLQLKLPYLVEEERGAAQFNKIKRQLVITVPVVQRRSPKPEPVPPPVGEEHEVLPSTAESDPPNPQDPPECPIFTCSQDPTSLTLIIHVKDIDEHSVTSEASNYQCEIRFCVKQTNAPHVLFVEFLPQYNLNTNNIAVNVSGDNMVIELTKSSECFGLWKNLYFGVSSNSLQERRFIDEDNVAQFLESGLRPSTIPWSTLEDQPLINVLDLTDRRTRIRLNRPELEEEHYLTDGAQISDVGEVMDPVRAGQTDTNGETGGDECQSPHLAAPCHASPAVQTPQLGTDDCASEDEGLCFKEMTPARELDEDDLPDGAEPTQSSAPNAAESVLKEVELPSGPVHVTADHSTQCAFKFENAVLFELD